MTLNCRYICMPARGISFEHVVLFVLCFFLCPPVKIVKRALHLLLLVHIVSVYVCILVRAIPSVQISGLCAQC